MYHQVDVEKLAFVIIPTRFYPAEFHTLYHKAYNNWKTIWSQTFTEEMGLDQKLYSDGFSRHSHVAILQYGSDFVCMTTLNCLDLNDEVSRDDSYFSVWPELTLERLRKQSGQVIACCNLALDVQFRKGAMGISWKDLMFALLVKHLQVSSYDAMVATVRPEKGMQRAAFRTGADLLVGDLPYVIEGRRIDIVRWKKSIDTLSLDPTINMIVNHVFNCSFKCVDHDYQYLKPGVKNVA